MSEPLQEYIDLWSGVVAENVELLRELDADDWSRPTDLPGWDVRAVASHLAHLESDLAGNPQPSVDVPAADHIHGPMGIFTESGVIARADWPSADIVDDLEASAAKRHAMLADLMPLDPAAPGDGFAAIVGWNWSTLLGNRVLDQWMHQQDIRRAVDRPGGLTGPAAAHVMGVFGRSLPFILGKRVQAPAGTSVVLDISGAQTATFAAQVGDDGRAAALDPTPPDPTARIAMDFETSIVLAGGRRSPDQVTTSVVGDTALGAAVLANLAVTP